jgi:hypothetical protein
MRLVPYLSIMVATFALAIGVAEPLSASIQVADSFNDTRTPKETHYGVAGAMWKYTPSSSYDLIGVETVFGPPKPGQVPDPQLTLEIYNEHPMFEGGTLLRSVTFTPVPNSFSGGFFSPLALVVGEDYFVSFRNVGDWGVNYAHDNPPTQMLPPGWIDRTASDDATSFFEESAGQLDFRSPILRFYTEVAAVPAPSSFATFAILTVMAVLQTIRPLRFGSTLHE